MPHPRERDKKIEGEEERPHRRSTRRRNKSGEPKVSHSRKKASESAGDHERPEGQVNPTHKISRLSKKDHTAITIPTGIDPVEVGPAEPVRKSKLAHQADPGDTLIKPVVSAVTDDLPEDLLHGYNLEGSDSGLLVATMIPQVTPDAKRRPNGINITPADYTLGETKAGLTVVNERPRERIKVYPVETMPALKEDSTPKKEPVVPLHVWEAAPVTALRKLAADTHSLRMSILLNNLEDPDALTTHGADHPTYLLAETEKFLGSVISECTPLLSDTESQSTILSNLTGLVDRVRSTTQTKQLFAPSFVEKVVRITAQKRVTPAYTELLSRFDIPPSLRSTVLQTLDNSGQLSQPLGWQFLDSLPDDHPFRKAHPDRVKLLSTLASPPASQGTDPAQSKESSDTLLQETNRFLSTTILESAQYLREPGGQEYIFGRLSAPTDRARFAARKIQLDSPGVVTEAVKAAEGKHITTAYLDYLYRFEIPVQQAGEILEAMDKTGNLHHKIAWSLLDTLPSDHPFKEKQRRRVDILTGLLTGPTLSEGTKSAAWRIAQGIVSVYPDPDLGNPQDKVGLEIECEPAIEGVTLPPGTIMGQDSNLIYCIPELRLIKDDGILRYDQNWRRRYDQIHRWMLLTQTPASSLHIHTNRTGDTHPEVFKMLFGFDYHQVKENQLGTIEIKGTALAGYNKHIQEGARGFSTEYMPELVELIKSLNGVELTPMGVSASATDRLDFFIRAVADPTSRAAMLLALRGDAGLRVRNPQNLSGLIDSHDSTTLYGLCHNFTALDVSLQQQLLTAVDQGISELAMAGIYDDIVSHGGNFEVIDPLLRQKIIVAGKSAGKTNESVHLDISDQKRLLDWARILGEVHAINSLSECFDKLDPSIRQQFTQWAIESRNEYAIMQLSLNTPGLEAPDLTQVINIAFESGYDYTIGNLGDHIGSMDASVQDLYSDLAQYTGNSTAIMAVGEHYGSLHPSVQEPFKQWTIETKNLHAVLALSSSPKDLDTDFQAWLVDSAFRAKQESAIDVQGANLLYFGADAQELYRNKAFETQNLSAVDWLNKHIGFLGEFTQASHANWFMQTHTADDIWEIEKTFDKISATVKKQIATWALNSQDPDAMDFLKSKIGSLDITFQEQLLPDFTVNIDDDFLTDKFDSLDPSLKPRVLAAVKDIHPAFYKAKSCTLPGWTYPALK